MQLLQIRDIIQWMITRASTMMIKHQLQLSAIQQQKLGQPQNVQRNVRPTHSALGSNSMIALIIVRYRQAA